MVAMDSVLAEAKVIALDVTEGSVIAPRAEVALAA